MQGCTNPARDFVQVTTFCKVAFYYLWILSTELASRHPFGTLNFEVAFAFLGNLCKLDHDSVILNPHLLTIQGHFHIHFTLKKTSNLKNVFK
jgi:hypothetical protein